VKLLLFVKPLGPVAVSHVARGLHEVAVHLFFHQHFVILLVIPFLSLSCLFLCIHLTLLKLSLLRLLFLSPSHFYQALQRQVIEVLFNLQLVQSLVENKAMIKGLVTVLISALESMKSWRLVGKAERDLEWKDELGVLLICPCV
jgi:hypothetical protein